LTSRRRRSTGRLRSGKPTNDIPSLRLAAPGCASSAPVARGGCHDPPSPAQVLLVPPQREWRTTVAHPPTAGTPGDDQPVAAATASASRGRSRHRLTYLPRTRTINLCALKGPDSVSSGHTSAAIRQATELPLLRRHADASATERLQATFGGAGLPGDAETQEPMSRPSLSGSVGGQCNLPSGGHRVPETAIA
jgi:hypothetical protein